MDREEQIGSVGVPSIMFVLLVAICYAYAGGFDHDNNANNDNPRPGCGSPLQPQC